MEEWLELAYKKLEKMIPTYATFRGKLGKSAKNILACCEFESEFSKLAELLGVYAYLKSTEDVGNSTYQGMVSRYMYLATIAGEASRTGGESRSLRKGRVKSHLSIRMKR